MNWEMIGAIAESVGALGVIASLVYLAIQIRDGTRATRRTNAHDVNESFRAWWAQLSESEETASIRQRGLTDPRDLVGGGFLRCRSTRFAEMGLVRGGDRPSRDHLSAWFRVVVSRKEPLVESGLS